MLKARPWGRSPGPKVARGRWTAEFGGWAVPAEVLWSPSWMDEVGSGLRVWGFAFGG